MPLKLAAPLEEDFVLTKTDTHYETDTGDPTKIRIRQASQAQTERRDKMFSEITRVFQEAEINTVQLRQNLSVMELMRVESYLTLVDCNITDEQGKSLFRFKKGDKGQELDMNEARFSKAWGKLPPLVANEIHEKVMLVNITWRPEGEAN